MILYMRALILLNLISVSFTTATSSPTLVNGAVYKIQSELDKTVLTANDNGILSKKLGIVKLAAWRNVDEQRWTIRRSPNHGTKGTSLRTLVAMKNANNLISFRLSTTSGSKFALNYWEVKSVGNDLWQLKSYPEEKCLQSKGNREHVVDLMPCKSGYQNQQWQFMICNNLKCSERSI